MARLSIRFRLLLLSLSLTVLPVATLTWTATVQTREAVQEAVIEANSVRMRWAGQYLEEQLYRIRDLFYALQIDETVMSSLEDGNDAMRRRELQSVLSSSYLAHLAVVDDIRFYMKSLGETVMVDSAISGDFSSPDGEQVWDDLADSPVNLLILNESDELQAMHTINRFVGQEMIGGLAATIDERHLEELRSIIGDGETGYLLMINSRGQILVDSPLRDMEWADILGAIDESPEGPAALPGAGDLLFVEDLDIGGVRMMKVVPSHVLSSASHRTMVTGITTGGLMLLAAGILSVVMSLRITRPIVDLARMMNRTTLPDFVPREVTGRDELGHLEERFNTLMSRTKELIDQEYVREIQLKGARLRALQAQINPHFLNNTLHMIGGMALARQAPEIYEITRAVGDLFRYANGSEGDLVTMADELEHTRNYLLIQQNRFADRLSWSIDDEDALDGILIPRFTLQPIVENAFEHGLQPKSGSWKISLRIASQKRGVLVIIRDDGVGMARETLRDVRQMLRSSADSSETHIGLRNVDARLRLHFGARRGLRIFSRAGSGTTIILNIPAVTNEEKVIG